MTIQEIYSNIQKFTALACDLTIDDIVIENQRKPRDLKPYVSFYLGGFRSISKPISRTVDSNGIQRIVTPSVCTANFTAISDGLVGAEMLLFKLKNSFSTELPSVIFKGELALNRTLKNISALPVEVDGQKESRAILALEFCFNVVIEDDVGIIEHLHLKHGDKEYIIN
jgi:hypothetical protein